MTAYVYAMDTLADWEIGHVTVELHSGRFFKVDAPEVCVKTVALAGAGLLDDRPITTPPCRRARPGQLLLTVHRLYLGAWPF